MANIQPNHQRRGFLSAVLHFRFLVVILAAVLMVFGILQLRQMPVDVLPEFSPPYVEIQTEALGLSPEEVERLITIPLEHNLLNGVAWLETIRSESVSGLSSVTLIFEPGTDLYRARQMVAERLSQAAVLLPRVSRGPVMLLPKSGTGRVQILRLSSKKLTAIQMSVLARWTITPRLMGVPGVANVATWGMRDRQLQVQVDPARLRAYQVSLLQVLESVGNALWVSTLSFVEAATPGNAGFIDTPQQRLGIQHISPIVSAESLSKVNVQGTGALLLTPAERDSPIPRQGGSVRLIDVADVVENHQPLIGDALALDGANLLLVIEKLPGSDAVKVTEGVEAALASLRPGLGGMEIDSTIFRPATFIQMARANLARAALIAGVVVVLMVGLFFFNWRAALISLITIPLSLIAAGLVLHLRGATLNMMVLLGLVIAIGVIVNNAINVVENILRRLRHPQSGGTPEMPRSPACVIVDAVIQTRGAMLFATLICLLAVLPAFSMQGVAGTFFRPLAITYALAVMASTIVALIVTPALCAILLPRLPAASPDRAASPFLRRLQSGYDGILRWILSRPSSTYLIIAVLAAVGLGAVPFLRPSLLPTFKERDLLVRLKTAPGTSHPAMVRLVDKVTTELRAIPGINNVAALVGRAVLGDQAVGINSAELWVNVAPTADYGATISAINAATSGYPGLEGEVQTHLNQTCRQVAPEASAPIVVRIYGQDWTILQSKTEEVRSALAGIAGVSDLKVSLPAEEPSLEVEVDLAAAQRHGINPGHVRRAASTLLNGTQVGSLFQEQKVFDVVVWSTPRTRGSVADIQNLLIDTPFDVPVRLSDVAQARIVPRPSLIRHEDVSRYADIAISVHGRDARSVRDEIQSRLKQIQFPLEYHAEVFAAYEQERSARNRLLAFTAIALIGILLLLQAAYESWRLAILSLLTLPLALVGGLAAVAIAPAPSISLGAVFGLLTVFGLAAHNQIRLIRRLRQLEQEQGGSSRHEIILQGTREGFASTLMTSLIIGLALLPLLFMGDVPGLEVLRPTALVILTGMVTCAFVDQFVMPALWLRWAKLGASLKQ